MKHLIMGTAGHIDHGKTALIKALTGFDCDTHLEEKQRGITIHLGFTHFKPNNEFEIGVIDVPGHKNFVNTMISGANSIDFVLFVISADSGIMPQTVEHLQILKLLKIQKGVIVLNKIDLVTEDILEILIQEIRDFFKGSFLETAPIVSVSAKTGLNIEQLIFEITQLCETLQDRPISGFYRQYIDRSFQVKGFGTIITGSVISGLLQKNDNLFLLPSGEELKIKRLERFNKETDSIQAGDRASVNLAGINSNEIKKGSLLSNISYEPTKMIDAKLDLFSDYDKLSVWSQCIFISGTYETQAKIHLLDRDQLKPGETGLVQIHLEKVSALCLNDRFIIRNSNSEITIGGGSVIDAYPLHHRRRTKKVVEQLKRISGGQIDELICHETKKSIAPISLKTILFRLNIVINIEDLTSKALPDQDIIILWNKKECYFWLRPQMQRYTTRIIKNLTTWHKNNPYDEYGKTLEELSGLISEYKTGSKTLTVQWIIQNLFEQKLIEKKGLTYALRSHKVTFDPKTNKALQWTDTYLRHSKMHAPLWSEMSRSAKYENISEKLLQQLLTCLVRRKKAYYIDETYLHYSIVDQCRIKLLDYLSTHPEGISVGDYRDLLNANRRLIIILLAQFDIEGIIKREGDLRIITDKGRKLLTDDKS